MLEESEQDTLHIAFTNDIHSHFSAMERIAEMVEQLREEYGSSMLLLDIGDHMDRAAVETEGTLGQANVDILNLTGYDAVTIGNNEGLTFTLDMLQQAYSGLICPVVCGNFREYATGNPPSWMNESLIIERGGMRIGLIGATVAYPLLYNLLGIRVMDPIATIAAEVRQMQNEVDLIVVMSHLGLQVDEEMAAKIPGIDLILGGHTHHLLEVPLVINNTTISAAGKYGQYLGLITITRDKTTGKPVVTDGQCIPVVEGVGSAAIGQALEIHRKAADDRMNAEIAFTDRTLELDENYKMESPFANFLAQAVRRHTDTEISLVNSGQLLGELPQGEITWGMLHQLCPSPINPCRMLLTGEDILYTLEQSLLPEWTERAISGYGFRGKVLGGICVDGMDIIYDPSDKPYQRIVQASVQGVPIQPERTYTVGTLGMFTFGNGYERIKSGKEIVYMLPEFLRDLLRYELQIPGALDQCRCNRWISIER